MGSKKIVKKKGGPSKSEILRITIAEILKMYEQQGGSPPDLNDVVQILEAVGLDFSIRTDFLRITLGAGISPVRVTWNHLVIWRDRPWGGKRGKTTKRKNPKK